MDSMVSGLAHQFAFYPAALAAITAALVTLFVAVNAWRNSAERRVSLQSNTSDEHSENVSKDTIPESDPYDWEPVDGQATHEGRDSPDESALKKRMDLEETVNTESNYEANASESRSSRMNLEFVNHVPLIKETTEIFDDSECRNTRNRDLGERKGAEISVKELDLTKLALKLPSDIKISKSKVLDALSANFEKCNPSSGEEYEIHPDAESCCLSQLHQNGVEDFKLIPKKSQENIFGKYYPECATLGSSKSVLLNIIEEGLDQIKRALADGGGCSQENSSNDELEIEQRIIQRTVYKDINEAVGFEFAEDYYKCLSSTDQEISDQSIGNELQYNSACSNQNIAALSNDASLLGQDYETRPESSLESTFSDSAKQELETSSTRDSETAKLVKFESFENTASCESAAKAEKEKKMAEARDSFNKCADVLERETATEEDSLGVREEESGENLLLLGGERSQGVGGIILTEQEDGAVEFIRSSCLLSPDVTSWSGKRAVQGSNREKQIVVKACSESRVLFCSESPHREGGVSPSPGSSMADSSSCTSHDATAKQPSDRFAPLDELVDHLRELAGCPTTVEQSGGGVGLLSDYYADSGRKSADSWEYSASDASNYASDSSQSLQLSSYAGDSSSNFSSGPDSPRVYRRNEDLVKIKQNELFSDLQETLSAGKSELKSHSLIKCCLGLSSGNSSPNIEETIKPCSGKFAKRSETRKNATMNESPRNARLLQLLQRDKERNERLSALSGRCSSDANEVDPRTTLQAIESAVDHMKQLIQEEEVVEECHGAHTTTRTMENDTEVRHFDLLTFGTTCGDQGLDRDTPRRCEEKPIDDEKISHANEESKQEWDELLSTVISVQSDYNDTKTGKPVESELITVKTSNRWRSSVESEVTEFSLTEDLEVSVVKASEESEKAINLRKAPGENLLPCANFIDQNSPSKIDGELETTKLNERGRKCPVSPACDVGLRSDQSPPSRSGVRGTDRVDASAANASAAFSDESGSKKHMTMDAEDNMMGKTSSSSSPGKTSPTVNAATNTTPTPTKIKNLRFKLDPIIYDLPSENGYYDDDDDQYNRRPAWRKQPRYQAFSSLDIGKNRQEPVKVVSVKTSVIPGGTKMVVKPVCVSEPEGQPSASGQDYANGNDSRDDSRFMIKQLELDLRICLETEDLEREPEPQRTQEKQIKRTYLSSTPVQPKKRSPIPDSYWNQSLSPVSENCDFAAVPVSEDGLLSTCSEPDEEHKMFTDEDFVHSQSFSDFGISAKTNGSPINGHDIGSSKSMSNISKNKVPMTSTPSRPSTLELNRFRKNLQLPHKKFVPDPDAVERITGFKAAESNPKPPLPPLPPAIRSSPLTSHRLHSGAKNRIDQLRKRYLDSKQMLANQNKLDSSAKFEDFLSRAQEDRAKIASNTPDLVAFEAAVRRQWYKSKLEADNGVDGKENSPPSDSSGISVRSSTPDESWMGYVQRLRRQFNRRSQSMTYLETDIDSFYVEDKSRSTMTLERSPPSSTQSLATPYTNTKQNRISVSLEESGRTKSEHELRVERSLQNLTLPDWYKHSQRPKTGFILDRSNREPKGWAAMKSLTNSTTSLTSTGTKPRKPAYSLRTSRENLIWSRGSASPASVDNSYSNRYTKHSSNAPVLSMALAKAFREPYMGWRAQTPSSCASPSPQVDCSPPSWVVMDSTERSDTPLTCSLDLQVMDEEEDTGLSFDGEDVLEVNESSNVVRGPIKVGNLDSPLHSADDTCNDIINISMDTFGQDSKSCEIPGEDTCDDIKNISMDTCELLPPNANEDTKASPLGDDTCDDVLNISSDTSCHVTPILNGNRDPSSVIGVTENTGLDIDEISTDTSNVLSQPITNDNYTDRTSPCRTNLNRSWGTDNCDKVLQSRHLVNGNKDKDDPHFLNGDHHHNRVNGNSSSFHRFPLSEPMTIEEKNRQTKRYSYNMSIYQNEMGERKKNLNYRNSFKMSIEGRVDRVEAQIEGSIHSLPGEEESEKNNIIWIESSFVGSRATTSILVLPTQDMIKYNGCKGSHESNTSVGRPASR